MIISPPLWVDGYLCVLCLFRLFCLNVLRETVFESYFNYRILYVILSKMYSYVKVFLLLLNQTTEVKTLPLAYVTQYHNSRPVMSQTVSHSRGSRSSTDHSIWHS